MEFKDTKEYTRKWLIFEAKMINYGFLSPKMDLLLANLWMNWKQIIINDNDHKLQA